MKLLSNEHLYSLSVVEINCCFYSMFLKRVRFHKQLKYVSVKISLQPRFSLLNTLGLTCDVFKLTLRKYADICVTPSLPISDVEL